MGEKRTLLNEIRSVLQYHQHLGVQGYPLDGLVEQFLALEPAEIVAKPHQRSVPAVDENRPLSKKDQQVARQNVGIVARQELLHDLQREVESCSACELHKHRVHPVAGKGRCNARLMIVGDLLSVDAESGEPHLFGLQQDQMMAKMLDAIHLAPQQVFISNIIKCGIPASIQPRANHVQTCSSYLQRQIRLVRPEMICTMGSIAAKTLLEKSHSLSRMRKVFHDLQLEDGHTLQVVCTYHPSYLLQNPEMKMATWEDLQMLARRLGTLK